MAQNLWWAAGYNIITIPLAAGILQNYGFVLPPAVGALIMSLSTVIVAFNSQTLRRYEPKGIEFEEKRYVSVDPVCGMEVSPEEAYRKIEYQEYVIYFCSKHCQEEFKRNPQKYISKLKRKEKVKREHYH